MPSRILISACLLGQPVRYDGGGKPVEHEQIARWQAEGRLLPLCPEMAGGLPVPRPAAEIEDGDAASVLQGRLRVMTAAGDDVSRYFIDGAEWALVRCREEGIRIAILKENSPSCGSGHVHDGTHSGTLVAGQGVTSALLRSAGIRVFSEHEIEAAAACIDKET